MIVRLNPTIEQSKIARLIILKADINKKIPALVSFKLKLKKYLLICLKITNPVNRKAKIS